MANTIIQQTRFTGHAFLIFTGHYCSAIETFQRRVYTPKILKLPDNAKIVDIGASIGDFGVFCVTSYSGSRCFAFEPTKEAYELCIENIHLNGLSEKIKCYPVAISNNHGKVKIGKNIYNSVTLKEIFKITGLTDIDLLKMDIEGAEYEVLLNTPVEFLRRIRQFTMECHIFDNGDNLSKLKNHLTDAGYQIITTNINAHNICYLYAIKG